MLMSDEWYACGECGAKEEFKQVRAMKIKGQWFELEDDECPDAAKDVQKCTACGAIDPETFMYACWEKEVD